MNGVLEGLKALGPARIVAMVAVAVGMLGLLAVLSLRGGGEHMALLYADLDSREAAQIAETLERQHIARSRAHVCCWHATACRPADRSATRSSIAATA